MRFSVTSRGRGLRGLSRSLERTEAVDRALREGAEQVRNEARDGLEGEGGSGAEALADSLEVEAGPRPLSYRAGTRAPLAWFREFGALARGQQPFLRPALDRARAGLVRRVGRAVRRAVSRRG